MAKCQLIIDYFMSKLGSELSQVHTATKSHFSGLNSEVVWGVLMNATALIALFRNLQQIPINNNVTLKAIARKTVAHPILNTRSLGTNPVEQCFSRIREKDRSGGRGRNDKSNAEQVNATLRSVLVAEKYIPLPHAERGFAIPKASNGKTYLDRTSEKEISSWNDPAQKSIPSNKQINKQTKSMRYSPYLMPIPTPQSISKARGKAAELTAIPVTRSRLGTISPVCASASDPVEHSDSMVCESMEARRKCKSFTPSSFG
ncbi:hypothetical protein DFJ73DRAFT_96571 [Zopfochytrium polystomum]|nr:hypothetical protein DFJ73DRAFT_96571 [Zopfochytrium polystomum]